jgi:hypothetical protein
LLQPLLQQPRLWQQNSRSSKQVRQQLLQLDLQLLQPVLQQRLWW